MNGFYIEQLGSHQGMAGLHHHQGMLGSLLLAFRQLLLSGKTSCATISLKTQENKISCGGDPEASHLLSPFNYGH